MNIVVAGGTGFVGGALVEALAARGDEVVVLSRGPDARRARPGGPASVRWDGRFPGPWTRAIDGADAVVNLSGESIAGGRWTPERKLLLVRSRVDSTRALVAAIASAARRPKVLVNASAVGFYGVAPGPEAAENAPQGRDFLAALCGQWEREALAAEPLGARVALARLGVVLAADGGALALMSRAFRLFAGGPLGSGAQPFPWIHRDDAVGALLLSVDSPELSGPVNLAAPAATTNAEFAAALGRALGRPSWLPTPAFALRLALGELADALLGGRAAAPRKLLAAGYRFKHPGIDEALSAVYR